MAALLVANCLASHGRPRLERSSANKERDDGSVLQRRDCRGLGGVLK